MGYLKQGIFNITERCHDGLGSNPDYCSGKQINIVKRVYGPDRILPDVLFFIRQTTETHPVTNQC